MPATIVLPIETVLFDVAKIPPPPAPGVVTLAVLPVRVQFRILKVSLLKPVWIRIPPPSNAVLPVKVQSVAARLPAPS